MRRDILVEADWLVGPECGAAFSASDMRSFSVEKAPVRAIPFTALGTLLVLALALRVSAVRHGKRIHLGDGGDEGVLRRIRAHANAIENLPLALLLLLLLELNQTQPVLLLWQVLAAASIH